ncbi:MAG: hypothetical protein P8X70_03550 [Nanoarchaeota archaeon]
MEVGITVFVVVALIIVIWVLVELKRVRHKVFALFLIGLILFLYFSSSFVFQGEDINFKSIEGISKAGKLYFSWLGSVFSNLKTVTTQAIKMDWKGNSTIG